MRPHGARCDVEPLGDLPVGAARGHLGQHLDLPRREPAGPRVRPPSARGGAVRGGAPGRWARAGADGRGEGLGEQDDHGARRVRSVPRPAGADVQHADVPAVGVEQALGHAALDAQRRQHLPETGGGRQEVPGNVREPEAAPGRSVEEGEDRIVVETGFDVGGGVVRIAAGERGVAPAQRVPPGQGGVVVLHHLRQGRQNRVHAGRAARGAPGGRTNVDGRVQDVRRTPLRCHRPRMITCPVRVNRAGRRGRSARPRR